MPALTDAQLALIDSGRLSMSMASRDMRRVPSLSRAVGCHASADRQRITLLLLRTQARQLLQDIAATRMAAAVFSLPSNHFTFQIKGRDAAEVPVQDTDCDACARHREAFAQELLPLGYSLEFSRAIHDFVADDLVAVSFTISDIFEQTPGPGAGARMGTPP